MPSAIGTYQVKASIDEANYLGEVNTTLSIIPPNTAPEATVIANQTVTYSPCNTLQISLFDYFSDAESADKELTYEVTANTDDTVIGSNAISSTDGILTLNVLKAGESNITVKATDIAGASASTSFKVTVNKAMATITFGATEFINDGTAKSVAVTTAPEGLAYSITYAGASDAPATPGEFEVMVVINDGNYEGSATTMLSILNIAPEAISLSSLSAFENQAAGQEVGALGVTDQNPNDSHSYSLPAGLSNNDLFAISDGKLITSTVFDYETKSSYEVTVMVADDQGGSYQQVFQIAVADVNDAPSLNTYEDIQIVQDLGQLSIQLSGLSNGGDNGQSFTLSTGTSGVVASASTVANSGNESVTVTFETAAGQQGNGAIEITIKDDGGTANGGVDSFSQIINVMVLPANISTTGVSTCGPGEFTLTASGADDYAWYSQPLEGIVVQTGSEFTESFSAETTYYVAGIFGGTESKLRVPVTVTFFEEPAVPVITNNNGQLSVSQQTDITYQWQLNGTDIEGATTNTFTPLVNGDYTVMATNGNGCTALSSAVAVLVTSVEAPAPAIEVMLYPNPASEFVDLDFGEVMNKGTIIRLVDNAGRELQMRVLEKAAKVVRLNVAGVNEGAHLVLVNDRGRTVQKRLIIKR